MDMPQNQPRITTNGRVGPIDAAQVPRYAGAATYARLPRLDQVGRADVAGGDDGRVAQQYGAHPGGSQDPGGKRSAPAKAKQLHDELETFYVPNMDFVRWQSIYDQTLQTLQA